MDPPQPIGQQQGPQRSQNAPDNQSPRGFSALSHSSIHHSSQDNLTNDLFYQPDRSSLVSVDLRAIPECESEGQMLANFFDKFESFAIAYRWNDRRMAEMLPCRLIGDVKMFWNTLPIEAKESYKSSKTALLDHFVLEHCMETAAAKLDKEVQHSNQSVKQYARRFKKYAERTHPVDLYAPVVQTDLTRRFINGLKGKLRPFVRLARPNDLTKAISEAISIESGVRRDRSPSDDSNSTSPSSSSTQHSERRNRRRSGTRRTYDSADHEPSRKMYAKREATEPEAMQCSMVGFSDLQRQIDHLEARLESMRSSVQNVNASKSASQGQPIDQLRRLADILEIRLAQSSRHKPILHTAMNQSNGLRQYDSPPKTACGAAHWHSSWRQPRQPLWSPSMGRLGFPTQLCWRCGRGGHLRRHCPTAQAHYGNWISSQWHRTHNGYPMQFFRSTSATSYDNGQSQQQQAPINATHAAQPQITPSSHEHTDHDYTKTAPLVTYANATIQPSLSTEHRDDTKLQSSHREICATSSVLIQTQIIASRSHTVATLLDTGAHIAAISENTFNGIAEPCMLQESCERSISVTGQQLQILGQLPVSVKVGKQTISVIVHVVKDFPYDFVFGIPCFETLPPFSMDLANKFVEFGAWNRIKLMTSSSSPASSSASTKQCASGVVNGHSTDYTSQDVRRTQNHPSECVRPTQSRLQNQGPRAKQRRTKERQTTSFENEHASSQSDARPSPSACQDTTPTTGSKKRQDRNGTQKKCGNNLKTSKTTSSNSCEKLKIACVSDERQKTPVSLHNQTPAEPKFNSPMTSPNLVLPSPTSTALPGQSSEKSLLNKPQSSKSSLVALLAKSSDTIHPEVSLHRVAPRAVSSPKEQSSRIPVFSASKRKFSQFGTKCTAEAHCFSLQLKKPELQDLMTQQRNLSGQLDDLKSQLYDFRRTIENLQQDLSIKIKELEQYRIDMQKQTSEQFSTEQQATGESFCVESVNKVNEHSAKLHDTEHSIRDCPTADQFCTWLLIKELVNSKSIVESSNAVL